MKTQMINDHSPKAMRMRKRKRNNNRTARAQRAVMIAALTTTEIHNKSIVKTRVLVEDKQVCEAYKSTSYDAKRFEWLYEAPTLTLEQANIIMLAGDPRVELPNLNIY